MPTLFAIEFELDVGVELEVLPYVQGEAAVVDEVNPREMVGFVATWGIIQFASYCLRAGYRSTSLSLRVQGRKDAKPRSRLN
jgi:hypothetical protein